MISVLFFKGSKKVLEKEFPTQYEAEDFVSCQVADYPYEYQIFDKTNNLLIDEGELNTDDEMRDNGPDGNFPDDESREGFDVNDFWNKD
jgi:hypothetical protein